ELRKNKGYTLNQLGELTELSKSLLSRIENYQVSPPIGTLAKIAHGLEVPIGIFFDEGEQKDDEKFAITLKNERKQVNKREATAELNYFSLSGLRSNKVMEPFIVKYPVINETPTKLYEHPGEEFLFVLKGKIEFVYGKKTIPLEAGDTVHFDPSTPHRVRNIGKARSECLVIVTDTDK
ncbi:MAG: helix-turn-helix transcriptional regulator, partial [Desulfobacteraceae bacterium]|nr:helix-turn-helix transcriptional regulator [Desulfobacteraceae bacterium]